MPRHGNLFGGQQQLDRRIASPASQAATGPGLGGLQPGSGEEAAFSLINQGPTDQQSALLQQIVDQRFQSGANALQRQGERLSSMLSGSAASRGLAKSSIGLGQQGLLGQSLLEQLQNLRGGLESQAAAQAFEIPYRNVAAATNLLNSQTTSRRSYQQLQEERRQFDASQGGGGLGAIAGAVAGSIIPGVGTALGGLAGGAIENAFGRSGGGGGGFTPSGFSANPNVNAATSQSPFIAPSSNPQGFQFPT